MYAHHASWSVRVASVIGALSLSLVALSAQTSKEAPVTAPADNTKVNTRDRAKTAVTADQQKEDASDRLLVQKIRRALVQDKTLSSYGHNVKVVAIGGQVTLKGPVRSEDEKNRVLAKASDVAGAGHVTNEVTVAPAKAKAATK